MTTVGAAWLKHRETEEGKKEYYYSLSFDEAIMPFVIDKNKRFILRENKNKNGNEKAPDYYIDVFIPDSSKAKKKENLQDPVIAAQKAEDDEFPF